MTQGDVQMGGQQQRFPLIFAAMSSQTTEDEKKASLDEPNAIVSVEEKNAETRQMRFDNARLDDFVVLGRYTLIICLFSELLILSQLSNMLYMVYAGAEPLVESCGTHVFDTMQTKKERCAFIATNKCVPTLSTQFRSVNYEFNHICADAKLVKQTISAQMLGVMFGSFVFGHLSDLFGRKKIMLLALVSCLLCMVGTSFSTGLTSFTWWRFFVCFFNGGTMVILMVFMVENLPKKDRFWISNIITWSPNMIVYAVVAYLTGDWRLLTQISAVLALPCICLLLYLNESPRFLVQSRNIEAARAAILRIYRIDGNDCDVELLDHVLNREEQLSLQSKKRKKYYYKHLFYTLTFTRYIVAVAYSLMVTSIINYSLLFNMEKLSGSIYWNSVWMGLFRYSCNLIIAFSDRQFKWLGRKLVHFIANTFSIVALGVCAAIYIFDLQLELANLTRLGTLSVIGICSLLYTANGIASNELFPTCIRNTSFSFGQLFSRVGVVLSPQIFLLAEIWTPLPYATMCVLSVVDLFLFQFNVDETKGKALVDSMPPKHEKLFGRRQLAAQDIELLPQKLTTTATNGDVPKESA